MENKEELKENELANDLLTNQTLVPESINKTDNTPLIQVKYEN